MSFEYLIDPEKGPQWKGLLPGKPQPYVLRRGEGEHAMLFTDLFTVLLSGDETENQFGIIVSESPAGDIIPTHSHNATHETFYVLEGKVRLFFEDAEGVQQTRLLRAGDFGYVPAGFAHAYKIEEAARMMGTLSGGFERFFQHMGTPTDHGTAQQPPFIPDFPRMQAAAQQHDMQFFPRDHDWSGAQGDE
jgi:quercetin 2,3-dioxygenase